MELTCTQIQHYVSIMHVELGRWSKTLMWSIKIHRQWSLGKSPNPLSMHSHESGVYHLHILKYMPILRITCFCMLQQSFIVREIILSCVIISLWLLRVLHIKNKIYLVLVSVEAQEIWHLMTQRSMSLLLRIQRSTSSNQEKSRQSQFFSTWLY